MSYTQLTVFKADQIYYVPFLLWHTFYLVFFEWEPSICKKQKRSLLLSGNCLKMELYMNLQNSARTTYFEFGIIPMCLANHMWISLIFNTIFISNQFISKKQPFKVKKSCWKTIKCVNFDHECNFFPFFVFKTCYNCMQLNWHW